MPYSPQREIQKLQASSSIHRTEIILIILKQTGKLVYLHFWHQHIGLRSAQGCDAHTPWSRRTYPRVWTSTMKSDRTLSGFNLFPNKHPWKPPQTTKLGSSLPVHTAFWMMHQLLKKIWFIHHDTCLQCYTSRKVRLLAVQWGADRNKGNYCISCIIFPVDFAIIIIIIIKMIIIIIIEMLSTEIGAAPIHHHRAWIMYVLASPPSSTMHATSMSCLMDNFLAPQYISVKHLTFIDTAQFNILSNEGPHQFKTWSTFSNACVEQR